MTLEETDITEEQLERVRDRSLEDAYEVHDVGLAVLKAKLRGCGYHVEDHGDDARHADKVFFGDGPDLAIYRRVDDGDYGDREPLGYIECKTKEIPSWFGCCNLRHYREYVNVVHEVDVPVFIWFGLVDADDERVIRDTFIEVEDTDQIQGDVVDISEKQLVFYKDDIEPVEGDVDLYSLNGADVVGIQKRDRIVRYIPDVHGNEVIELNSDEFISMPEVNYRLDG